MIESNTLRSDVITGGNGEDNQGFARQKVSKGEGKVYEVNEQFVGVSTLEIKQSDKRSTSAHSNFSQSSKKLWKTSKIKTVSPVSIWRLNKKGRCSMSSRKMI